MSAHLPRSLTSCVIGLLSLAAGTLALAQADPASPAAAARSRVGLVLAGGGAKGGAHVGVLKVLEDLRVPVDCIAGTSMGALIGGLYASGMSAERIEQELRAMNWVQMFNDRVERPRRHAVSRRGRLAYWFGEYGLPD